MTEIYLCDDEYIWIEQMEQAVLDFMISSDWALTVTCKTSAPRELLEQLLQHKTSGGIYFLDINLKSEMNGITLGAEIRKLDPEAVLIFVTSHDELVMDTFRLKLQATDYILKTMAVSALRLARHCALWNRVMDVLREGCPHRASGLKQAVSSIFS